MFGTFCILSGKFGQDVWEHHFYVLRGKRDGKGRVTRTRGRKCGNSMTSKQNRGGPASPSHPPWLHGNTRAMLTLQTHSFPLSSATLHYPVLSQAQRGTAPLSPHYSRVPAHSQAPLRPRQGIRCPSGMGSHSLYMHGTEVTPGVLHWYHIRQWLPTFFGPPRLLLLYWHHQSCCKCAYLNWLSIWILYS